MNSDNTAELYREILDNLDIGIAIFDTDMKYTYINDAYCRATHNPPEFYSNLSITDLINFGFFEKGTGIVEKALSTGKTVYNLVSVTDKSWGHSYNLISTAIPVYHETRGDLKYVIVQQELEQYLLNRLQICMNDQSIPLHIESNFTSKDTENFIAESPIMKNIISLADSIAKSDVSVLLEGDSGTGKEVLAHYIYKNSSREDKPFVVLNCGAIPESLIESELFGYEKGAFTGALSSGKIGLLEAANNGTLFLDEINSMPLSMQTKLLRVLETKKITRIGSTKERPADFRLICATNENLISAIDEKRFRWDLYYRINVISIKIPPLRERQEDILPLAKYFVSNYCTKYHCIKTLGPVVIDKFMSYPWPGNVRELKNIIERLIVTSPPDEFVVPDISFHSHVFELSGLLASDTIQPAKEKAPSNDTITPDHFDLHVDIEDDRSYQDYIDEFEKILFETAAKKFSSVSEMTKALQLNKSTIYRKLKKYGITK